VVAGKADELSGADVETGPGLFVCGWSSENRMKQ